MEGIINELSFIEPLGLTKEEGEQNLIRLFGLLNKIKESKDNPIQYFRVNPYPLIHLKQNYTIEEWLKNPQKSPQSVTWVNYYVTTFKKLFQPDLTIYPNPKSICEFCDNECQELFNEEPIGFGYAAERDLPVISTRENSCWADSFVKFYIEQDENKRIVEVAHISNENHLEALKNWFWERLEIELIESIFRPQDKSISISNRGHHGTSELNVLAKKLVQNPYVNRVICSKPNESHTRDFIFAYPEYNRIHIVLIDTDEGFGLEIETTARNERENVAIGRLLNEKFNS